MTIGDAFAWNLDSGSHRSHVSRLQGFRADRTGPDGAGAVRVMVAVEGAGEQLPGEHPLGDAAADKCSPRPPFTGIISTLLICCCSIHIHTLPAVNGNLKRGGAK